MVLVDVRKWLESLVARWAQDALDEWEADRASAGRWTASDEEEAGFDVVLTDLYESLTQETTSEFIGSAVRHVLAEAGRPLNSKERALLNRLATRAMIEVIERQQARASGDYRLDPLLPPAASSAPPLTRVEASALTLGEAVERYVADHKDWSKKFSGQVRVALRYFVELVGSHTPLRSISKDDVRRYRDAMRNLPPNVGAQKKYKGKSLNEILAMGDAPGLTEHTVYIYVNRLGGLFSWAHRMDYVDKNVVTGVMPKPKRRPRDERKAFTDADLRLIFSGDFSELRNSLHPEDYWMPLLMLHTGCRNEEVAQLRINDIEEVEGVPCVCVRDDDADQKVKTATSRRNLPLHPTVLELGFLGYVSALKRREEVRLFPMLTKGSNGWHDAASRRFNRRLRRIGVEDERKTAYSFRHTFATRLRDANVKSETISELLGHAHQTMTMGRYVKDPSPRMLLEAVQRLDFREPLGALISGKS